MSLVEAIENDRAQTESRKGDVVYSPPFDPGCEAEVAWNGTLQRVIVPYAEADRARWCLEYRGLEFSRESGGHQPPKLNTT
jgi:hypothetical protein